MVTYQKKWSARRRIAVAVLGALLSASLAGSFARGAALGGEAWGVGRSEFARQMAWGVGRDQASRRNTTLLTGGARFGGRAMAMVDPWPGQTFTHEFLHFQPLTPGDSPAQRYDAVSAMA